MGHSESGSIMAEFTKLGETISKMPPESRQLAEAFLKGVLAGLGAVVGGEGNG